jgi:hypothetical protein
MLILDTTGGCIPGGTIVSSYSGSTIGLSNPTTCAKGTPSSAIALSSGLQVSLSQPANYTGQVNLSFSTALYRLVGALYTDGSSDVVQFVQDGNTFYLAKSVTDIRTAGDTTICAPIGSTPQSCQLSVPCGRLLAACATPGLKVIGFGRIVGGIGGSAPSDVLLSSPDQTAQSPNPFPGPPAFKTDNVLTNTAYPFHLATDGNGNVRVQASTTTNVYEVTDGWSLDLANAGQASPGGSGGAGNRAMANARPIRKHH